VDDEALAALEAALQSLAPADREASAALAAAAAVASAADLDADDVAAATRRGLLLAAAGGDPAELAGPGSRAALETAAELHALGAWPDLARGLDALRSHLRGSALTALAAGAETLAADEAAAAEAVAVVLLQRALAGE
jgi:hypothetical protein